MPVACGTGERSTSSVADNCLMQIKTPQQFFNLAKKLWNEVR